MTISTARLQTLCRLRTRDLDRARQTLTDASAHHASCHAAVAGLEASLRQHHLALDAARVARCRAPADEMAQLILDRREREYLETQALLDAARQRLADATTKVQEARAALVRAQTRDEATAGLHHQAVREDRRRRDRRADNEREDHRRRA